MPVLSNWQVYDKLHSDILPLATGRSAAAREPGARNMEQETILVVDDNKEIVSALTDVLKSKGYGILAAYNGRTGLHLALEKRPDLILLDWNLPQLSRH
jgi:response regulator RpfG family c-di-GMP phosphodiesterase